MLTGDNTLSNTAPDMIEMLGTFKCFHFLYGYPTPVPDNQSFCITVLEIKFGHVYLPGHSSIAGHTISPSGHRDTDQEAGTLD